MPPVIAPAAVPPAAVSAPPAVVQKAKPAPHGWTTYTVRSGDNLSSIADRTGTTVGALVARNHLRDGGSRLSVGQHLSVPKTAAQARAEAARAKAAAAARAAAIRRATYVVRSGDTLSGIAARKGVSLAALLKANHLSTRSVIHIGQKVRIPGAGAASTARPAASAPTTATYTVRSGDTLSAIAARTKTPLGTLYKLNRLSARTVIHPGQHLRVRGTSASAARRASTTAYTVVSGDTLSGIAARKGVSLASLLKANHLSARTVIHVGQKLRVPSTAKPVSPSTNTFAGRTYPQATVSAANRNREALAARSVPSRTQTRAMIVATARRHGVDPTLALAVAWQESGWNQRQVSVANAIGVMQVIPSSGEWASQMVGRRLNLLNTQDNITAGVAILRSLTRSASNTDQAIAGYYQGLASVQKNGMYADTKSYVKAVKSHRGRM
ncbi:LysM peptidoglycan-binding domain-containing protein [Phycicoccus sp. M110.8]|uniref:LysM peptidoglycan-binding domain-containing protein n=1 Tax=Phycicoccus sp. M110.8 TaxID=3075433 RepID=UPI0028FD2328|nr:LysM peptidoglycan-binding domain-containing protein [Phycicoccus sp. M110.8]MDU0315170.1 LysM peptidoglycan-binding domain-containing protein [Phycicoccus sp. M110.8]